MGGADDYLTKPFVTEELLARLRALGRRREQIVLNDTLKFEQVMLNLSTYELSHSTKSIKLGLKELSMMQILMTYGIRVVSKEELLQKVWGYESEAEYNHVEVYISFLRKKLQHIGAPISIVTIRGVGYCLGGSER